MKDEKIYNELIKILMKKANGFYYTEEQEDYEKTQNKSKISEKAYQNVSFFENFDTVKTKSSTVDDTIKATDETKKTVQNLTLVKKKITTHYIPPDMLAVKILFETLKEKVNENDINTLTDDELLKLKDKLLGEINNENND